MQTAWRKTTCGKARCMLGLRQFRGLEVWWRPDGILNPNNPDDDLALVSGATEEEDGK